MELKSETGKWAESSDVQIKGLEKKHWWGISAGFRVLIRVASKEWIHSIGTQLEEQDKRCQRARVEDLLTTGTDACFEAPGKTQQASALHRDASRSRQLPLSDYRWVNVGMKSRWQRQRERIRVRLKRHSFEKPFDSKRKTLCYRSTWWGKRPAPLNNSETYSSRLINTKRRSTIPDSSSPSKHVRFHIHQVQANLKQRRRSISEEMWEALRFTFS